VIDVMLTWSDKFPEVTGRMLADVATEWGVDQKTACRRLMPGGACYFQMDEEDVERVIAHPLTMIGSDGLPHDRHPHPRLWGAFPRVFARYWRERKLFTLEQAVHKMTGMTARNLRIADRGLLKAGAMAEWWCSMQRRCRHRDLTAGQRQRGHRHGVRQRPPRLPWRPRGAACAGACDRAAGDRAAGARASSSALDAAALDLGAGQPTFLGRMRARPQHGSRTR
jgi:hypothetical protein